MQTEWITSQMFSVWIFMLLIWENNDLHSLIDGKIVEMAKASWNSSGIKFLDNFIVDIFIYNV